MCGLASKGLESALGVFVGQTHDGACEAVVATTKEAPVKRLMLCLSFLVQPARADGDVRALGDGLEQQLSLFDRGGKVRVGEHNDSTGGLQKAVPDREALATVGRIFEQKQLVMLFPPVLHDLGGPVGGAVVDDQDLRMPVSLAGAAKHAVQRLPKAFGLIVSGNDDADLWALHGTDLL